MMDLTGMQPAQDEWRTDEHVRNGMHVLVFFRPKEDHPTGSINLHKEEVEQWKKLIKTLNNK